MQKWILSASFGWVAQNVLFYFHSNVCLQKVLPSSGRALSPNAFFFFPFVILFQQLMMFLKKKKSRFSSVNRCLSLLAARWISKLDLLIFFSEKSLCFGWMVLKLLHPYLGASSKKAKAKHDRWAWWLRNRERVICASSMNTWMLLPQC